MLKLNFHSQRFFKMWSAAATVGLLAVIAFSSPTSAATFTLAELAAGQTFTIGSVEFVDWVFENPTVNLNVVTVDTIDDVNLPGFQVNGNGELRIEVELEYTFTVRTTNDEPLIRGALLEITAYSAAPESEINVNPIIAKNLAVGAAFSRDSRLQGAPTRPDQNLTGGEFQKQHEIVIASCKSCGEMGCRVVINATVGLTPRFMESTA